MGRGRSWISVIEEVQGCWVLPRVEMWGCLAVPRGERHARETWVRRKETQSGSRGLAAVERVKEMKLVGLGLD